MKDKILAILVKEAPLVQWSIVFGEGFENKENAPALAAFCITGTLGEKQVTEIVDIMGMLNEYGEVIRGKWVGRIMAKMADQSRSIGQRGA